MKCKLLALFLALVFMLGSFSVVCMGAEEDGLTFTVDVNENYWNSNDNPADKVSDDVTVENWEKGKIFLEQIPIKKKEKLKKQFIFPYL